MLKIFQSLKKCDVQYLPSLYYQNVRWVTKPRWVPIAKTKVFRVPTRRVYPPEETAEMNRLTRLYKTQMKSVKYVTFGSNDLQVCSFYSVRVFLFRQLFDDVHRANETSEEVLQRLEQEKEDHWKKCMEINNQWNQQVALERAQRDAESLEEACEAARERLRMIDQREKERLEELEEVIRQEKVSICFRLIYQYK